MSNPAGLLVTDELRRIRQEIAMLSQRQSNLPETIFPLDVVARASRRTIFPFAIRMTAFVSHWDSTLFVVSFMVGENAKFTFQSPGTFATDPGPLTIPFIYEIPKGVTVYLADANTSTKDPISSEILMAYLVGTVVDDH